MQIDGKKLTIYLACLCVVCLTAYAFVENRGTLNARHTPLSSWQSTVSRKQQQADSLLKAHEDIKSELSYYLKAHRVDDEGYDMIADYNMLNDSLILMMKSHLHILPIDFLDPLPTLLPKHLNVISMGGYWDKKGWHKGTPPFHQGMIADSLGIYLGVVNNNFQPDGHGMYKSFAGSYFEGEWEDGVKHGFGFRVQPYKDIQVGIWVKGRYKGERLTFTSERIYGIDISRHQHEKNGRRFPINWKALRIVDLGKHNQQNVTGEADYPVSFIYIKATEGTTITNQYFVSDYKAARANGYHVGAYHFYSVKSDALEQAKHFLETAKFSKGDFPPVFDVEPYDAQVEALGGADKLLSEMRVWLRTVERALGIKPILYVNQSFVNKYLSNAPDLKRGYSIWIARYSEYKPDIRLCWWQLSATGRVRGIEGDVDINVFNGYGDQWEEFISTELFP